MDELASKQHRIGEEIQKTISNYKKDSEDRKTIPYLEKRLQKLTQLWDEFEVTDNEIREAHAELDHLYFTEDYYNGIRTVYEHYSKQMQEKLITSKKSMPLAVDHPPTDSGNVEFEKNASSTTRNPTEKNPFQKVGAMQDDKSQPSTNERGNQSYQGPDLLTKLIRRQRATFQSFHHLLQRIRIDEQLQPAQYYEHNIQTINRQWEKIEELHNQIWELIEDPEAMDYNSNEFFDVEEQVHTTLIKLAENLSKWSNAQSTQSTNTTINATMKLPKITLPTFDGDYLKWRTFYDLFEKMVHEQPMGDCQKMWYLKTHLTGEAERLIRHFSLSNDNYSAAWNMLKNRYNNRRLLVTALLNKLLSQPTLQLESSSAIKAMHDTTHECLMGLVNLGIPIETWDPLVLHILLRKLDGTTHNMFEQSLSNPRELQSIETFLGFLETRFQALEALGNKGKTTQNPPKGQLSAKSFALTTVPRIKCISCTGNHQLFSCPQFSKLTPQTRLTVVKKNNLCLNCLKPGHAARTCTSRSCTKCAAKHNTLLHFYNQSSTKTEQERRNIQVNDQPQASSRNEGLTACTSTGLPELNGESSSATLTAKGVKYNRAYVVLGTVLIQLTTSAGSKVDCRAILDSGSQLNFITEGMVKKLGFKGAPDSTHIEGIGQIKTHIRQRINVLLQSKNSGFSSRLEASVLPKITSCQPTQLLDISNWNIPTNIRLADPHFNEPREIDFLIGAEIYHQLMSVGQIRLGENLPILQNTLLGWIVSGKVTNVSQLRATCGMCNEDAGLDRQLEKFWSLEQGDNSETTNKFLTPAEKRCELHFSQTTFRNTQGRFVVKLPFEGDPNKLGDSVDMAQRRFFAIERKLAKNDELRDQYVKFMTEYISLGHMVEIDLREIHKPYYFLPHHCVTKPESSSTKLRVVFDASATTSSKISLNDILAAGPKVQEDLFSILLRFRLPRFVFTADVEKMYRQIEVNEDDRKFQLIFWRNHPNDSLRCYQLSTVTYGTTSAPYLATRCLLKLAEEEQGRYPLGAEILKRDFYVDDVLTGSDSLSCAIEGQTQLKNLLWSANFNLRKWCANHPRLLENFPQEDLEVQLDFDNKVEEHVKALGLTWLPKTDVFCIRTSWIEQGRITKRTVCSDIARLFDPLGIMAPVVVTAKIYLQQLWALKLDWDAALPMELHTKWTKFREDLKLLDNIKIPRHIYSQQLPNSVQIHAFSDASQKAYGAAIYIRSVTKSKQVIVRLLCAKSRVAPIKQTTLPRLELCAAKLAAELTDRVKADMNFKAGATFYWTDSEIVLSWLNASSASFHTFVANRIAAIQTLSLPQQWRHVDSKQNPADILSRGINPGRLEGCHLWFYGPPFLHGSDSIWPAPFLPKTECDQPERKRMALQTAVEQDSVHFVNRIDHHNSFRRLKRITAYILRFVSMIKDRNKHETSNCLAPFTVKELDEALFVIIKAMQEEYFKEELIQLSRNKELNKNNPLSNLAPFLDQRQILRVGGRLEAATISYDAKHPILLPYSDPFTKLLMTDLHIENLHVGPQTLLAITRERFWPVKGKIIARSIVQHCVRCARAKPKMLSQLMGNLPPSRVQPARPFANTGVDFCGPIWTHFKTRGKKPQKSYIAVFCCFSTKAIHLEIVSDLTTQAFLGALKRFMGRRGHCRNLYCDNATNFTGARNELSELRETIYSDKAAREVNSLCQAKGTDFHFIPPRAPHFGGLWEAAVKSAKHLLQRSMSAASLTYEELETLAIEVEAILNSRPLTPMSSNPNDLSALTPGHFLIGEALTSSIDADARPMKANLLTRWKLVSHLKNEFWKRWSKEYLNELQYRHKWKEQRDNIQPNTMVIIREENLPSLKWPLGRIVKTYKGDDGLVRVADVRTSTNILRRPIHKLSPLPILDEKDNNVSLDETGADEGPAANQRASTSEKRSDSPPKKRVKNSLGSAIALCCSFA